MRKVDELNDAVNHGVTERYHGVDATERKTIHELLQKDIHRRILAYGLRLFIKQNGTVSGAVFFVPVAPTSLALLQASLVQLPGQQRPEPVLLSVRRRELEPVRLQTWSQRHS
jgi:hypothetical protein